MAELGDIFETEFIPRFVAFHDCVDTGTDITIVGGAPAIPFPCDGLGWTEYNVKKFFTESTSNIKDGIPNAVMLACFDFTIDGSTGDTCFIDIDIPNPLSPTHVGTYYFSVPRNTPWPFYFTKQLYNGAFADAHEWGFDIKISSLDTVVLKARSISTVQL